jgi:hypothetical protein
MIPQQLECAAHFCRDCALCCCSAVAGFVDVWELSHRFCLSALSSFGCHFFRPFAFATFFVFPIPLQFFIVLSLVSLFHFESVLVVLAEPSLPLSFFTVVLCADWYVYAILQPTHFVVLYSSLPFPSFCLMIQSIPSQPAKADSDCSEPSFPVFRFGRTFC